MSGFIEGEDRHQATLFPESLDEYIAEDSALRVIDVFINDLGVSGLGFKTEPADTGRPGYHPKTMLKLYVYGYLNDSEWRSFANRSNKKTEKKKNVRRRSRRWPTNSSIILHNQHL